MGEWSSEEKDLRVGIEEISDVFKKSEHKRELIKSFIKEYLRWYKYYYKRTIATQKGRALSLISISAPLRDIIGQIPQIFVREQDMVKMLGRVLGSFFAVVEFRILAKEFAKESSGVAKL